MQIQTRSPRVAPRTVGAPRSEHQSPAAPASRSCTVLMPLTELVTISSARECIRRLSILIIIIIFALHLPAPRPSANPHESCAGTSGYVGGSEAETCTTWPWSITRTVKRSGGMSATTAPPPAAAACSISTA